MNILRLLHQKLILTTVSVLFNHPTCDWDFSSSSTSIIVRYLEDEIMFIEKLVSIEYIIYDILIRVPIYVNWFYKIIPSIKYSQLQS